MNSPRFASACHASPQWEEALQKILSDLPRLPQANLGFLYVSDAFASALELILGRLKQHTGVLEWVGATGVGIIGAEHTALETPGISVLLGAFPLDSFRVFSGRHPLPRSFQAYAAFVHGDPVTPDMGDLVHDMAHKIRGGRLAGGLASAKATAWHIASECLTGGLSGVAFNKDIQMLTGISQGCAPLPGNRRITQAQDSLIDRIDGRPAVEVFREAAGPELGADLRRAATTLMMGLTEDDQDRRLYSVRRIVALDLRTQRIAINSNVEKGQHFIFVKRDVANTQQDLVRMLGELKAAYPHPPKNALYVSCASRGSVMFDRDNSELKIIREAFGDIPLAGFFAAGEIAGDRYFGYTGTLTLFL
ncbi:MAG: FIST C-terminal domain-containing protein [Uliginosibacterium sp.]|nr:FIST C-terminal domain-containing protein [Uliginosibacterium sp.]